MQPSKSVMLLRSLFVLGLLVGMVAFLWFIGTNPLGASACSVTRAAYSPDPTIVARQQKYNYLTDLLTCKRGKVIAQGDIKLVYEEKPDVAKLTNYKVEEIDLPTPTDFSVTDFADFRLGDTPLKKTWRITVTGERFAQYTGNDYRPWTISLDSTPLDCMGHTVPRLLGTSAQCVDAYLYNKRDTLMAVVPNSSLLHDGVTLSVQGPHPVQAYEPITIHFTQAPTE